MKIYCSVFWIVFKVHNAFHPELRIAVRKRGMDKGPFVRKRKTMTVSRRLVFVFPEWIDGYSVGNEKRIWYLIALYMGFCLVQFKVKFVFFRAPFIYMFKVFNLDPTRVTKLIEK